MDYLTLEDVVDKLEGAMVFARVDTNTTLIGGEFEPNQRIVRAGNTIKYLTEHGARVIVGTHNGRPSESDFVSVGPLTSVFRNNLIPITNLGNTYEGDNLNDAAIRDINELRSGEALLLENLRFLPGESTKMTPEEYAQTPFIRGLIDDCGVSLMVSDGFSITHRTCRSILGFEEIPNVAGLNMQQELDSLSQVYEFFYKEQGDNVYVLGGTKIQDYFALMENSLSEEIVQKILPGGLLANLILHVQGIDIGEPSRDLLERKDAKGNSAMAYAERLSAILDKYPSVFEIPCDVAYDVHGERQEFDVGVVPHGIKREHRILDLGHKTIDEYSRIIRAAQLVYMKGPAGRFEDDEFNFGSRRLLNAMTGDNIFSVLGGGDTSVMLTRFRVRLGEINYVSLAGGALLLALAGEELPGVRALQRSYEKFG